MDLPTFKQTFNLSGESLLPHRPPFLFLDRLIAADETGALGEYTFTREKNDFFYDGVDIINGVERRVFLGLNHWLELGKQYNPDINIASKTKALD